MKYRVRLHSHHAPEVARREITSVDDIPNFEDEDISAPWELNEDQCTNECLEAPGASIWFEDKDGSKVATFNLDPLSKNGIKYIDRGYFFDESNKSKSYFYFEMDWDKQRWTGSIEIDGEIDPKKISINFFRYKDQDGDERLVMDPDSVRYDGEELDFACDGGDGSDGQVCWTLIKGVRTVVDP